MVDTAAMEAKSALLVIVAEAEAAVGAHRAVLDSAAAKGVPAHITVLYPFVPPDLIDETVLAAVQKTVLTVPRFDAELARVAWFGDLVAYLEPTPGEPFRALIAALCQRFPECPPYGGAFADVVPHLTIGHDAGRDVLAAAGADIEPHLPIRIRVESVRLMAGTEAAGSWHTLAEFPLA
jgi:2'-5' RNA ligase